MAALPYMPLYIADYLCDTQHLTTEEHGAYLLLMMNYWQTGKPIIENRIPFIARLNGNATTVVETLKEFFNVTDDGLWIHDRIERDLEKVRASSRRASEAGKASARAKAAKKAGKQTERQPESNDRCRAVEGSVEPQINHTDTDTDTEVINTPLNPPRGKGDDETDLLERERKFVELWNSTPGVITNRGDALTKARRRKFRSRLKDRDWPANMRDAIKKFPLQCFADRDDGWKPDMDWILAPDSVSRILEGKYDWKHGNPFAPGSEAARARDEEDKKLARERKHRQRVEEKRLARKEREEEERRRQLQEVTNAKD